MSIHTEHPFLTPEPDRDPVRRARGRLNAPVTIWTTGAGRERAGLTVSSMIIAEGRPAELIGLVNPDSALGEVIDQTRSLVVNVLGGADRTVSDVFADRTPSPGGKFRTGDWTDTDWGPALQGVPAWIGARLVDAPLTRAGWAYLVRAEIQKVHLSALVDGDHALGYLRGHYHFPAW
ncbi:flavin reductase family protein [Microlunatus sp. Gsoil 973]|uniref:flavin reductase family protein n=1 Tax=Microlunatus sp. Gsoil 973 TaxID=2672569 RepID=UPI0018A83E76|nr:flavin reductase family protein [Microlunatus sp. Gsoil 973]